jgi:putative ABC transport system permease protein
MNKIENLKIGLAELKSNKMRTSLTMLGIIFGVGAVIAMLSIGEGARQETLEQIELMGTNNIIINQKAIKTEAKGAEKNKALFSPGLSIKDAMAIKDLNPFVEEVTYQKEIPNTILYRSEILQTKIVGTTAEYITIYNSQLSGGDFFKKHHLDDAANVCVIGPGIKKKLFKFEDPIKKQIKIGSTWFTVLGVIASKNISSSGAQSLGMRDFNNEIYVPYTTLVYKLGISEEEEGAMYFGGGMRFSVRGGFRGADQIDVVDKSSADQVTVKIKKGLPVDKAGDLISRQLLRRHYGTEDYEIVIPEALLEQKQKTQKIFNIVMGAIAGISLLVGGIGIMNIMLANILERTREIGIRRAIGATRNDVLSQFLYEAMVISILGGVIGIIVGFLLTSLITTYAEWRTVITPFSIILAFVVSVLIGVGFGSYPAKKAADKDPIESLRYE